MEEASAAGTEQAMGRAGGDEVRSWVVTSPGAWGPSARPLASTLKERGCLPHQEKAGACGWGGAIRCLGIRDIGESYLCDFRAARREGSSRKPGGDSWRDSGQPLQDPGVGTAGTQSPTLCHTGRGEERPAGKSWRGSLVPNGAPGSVRALERKHNAVGESVFCFLGKFVSLKKWSLMRFLL